MKKKFIKKISILLSTVLMAQVLLTGCGGGKETSSNVNANGDIILEKSEDGKINGVLNAEGLPLVDEGAYSFSLFVDNSSPLENQFAWQMLEDQTNVKVDVKQYAFEIATEKYGLALSSGDYADCIGGWILSSSDILTYGMNMGIFIPLEDYIDELAPNIKAVLDLPGVRETMTAPDGHIYSIPYVTKAPKVDFNPYINKRWLDNLGLEVPTTTEELREVLRAFKEQDANGNGNPNDEIPFSADPNNRKLGYLAGWFGMPVDPVGFTMVGDKLEFGANSEAYKNLMEYFASLNAEGLLDPELFTQDLATWKGKGTQDLYGVCLAYGSGDFLPFETGVEPDFVPLPVLSSPGVDNPLWLKNTDGVSILKNQVVITDKAKNPEVIVKWWDNLYETDNSVQILHGPFGTTVEKIDDKTYKVDRSQLTPEEEDLYSWANMFCQSLPKYVPNDVEVIEGLQAYPEKDYVDESYEPYFTEVIPSYWVEADLVSKLSEYQVAIKDYIDQKTATWISGQADVNAEWEEYLKQLDKLGLEEYIKIRKNSIGQE